MDNLKEKIQAHFSKPEIIKNLDDLVLQNFTEENIKKMFLDIFEATKNGDFNCDDLLDYLTNWLDIEMEKAIVLDDKLFDQVYGDVYKELRELYNIKQKEKEKRTQEEINNKEVVETEVTNNLEKKYNSFTMSSLFQNILASEESFKAKYVVNGVLNINNLKEEFYEALNSSDKIKVVGALRVLAGAGQLGSSFASDQRYLDFWGNFLERHYGVEIKQKFLVEPINKKYFLEFLRFVLEKRLNFNTEESAMVGMGLSGLCGTVGESALAEMAYGDESKNGFVWNE